MTSRELARLLLLYPERPACVLADGVLREVERVRVTDGVWLPPLQDGIVARGQVLVVEASDDQPGGCGIRSTVGDPIDGPAS